MPKFGGSLDFTRVYDSEDFDVTSLGKGWTHSFAARVSMFPVGTIYFPRRGDIGVASMEFTGTSGARAIETAGEGPWGIKADDYAELRTPSGRRLLFRHTGNGQFAPPVGEPSTLVLDTAAATGYTWTLPDKTVYRFTPAGRLTSIKDRNNNTVNLDYDGSGNLTTVRDPDNRTLYTFAYSGGRLQSVTDLAARSVTFGYDGGGRLASASGPKGNVSYGYTAYTIDNLGSSGFANGIFSAYSQVHLLTSITSPNGHVTSFTYGPPSKAVDYAKMPLFQAAQASGGDTGGFVLGNAGFGSAPVREGTTSAPEDKAYFSPLVPVGSSYVVDTARFAQWFFAQRFLTTSESGPSGTFTFSHTIDDLIEGGKTVVTDPLGQTETRTWENLGGRTQSSEVSDAAGGVRKIVYDANRNPAQITDRAGRTIQVVYDPRNNPTRLTDALGQSTNVSYDPVFNKVTSVSDPKGNPTNFTHDSNGNLIQVRDALNNQFVIVNDAQGLPISIMDPHGKSVLIGRNAQGLATSITDPLNRVAELGYDTQGRLTSVKDGAGRSKSYQYDGDDNLTLANDALGGQTVLHYDPGILDGQKLLREIRDARNNSIQFGYDSKGRRTSITRALGPARTYQYNDANQLIQVTKLDGAVITFEYDPLGRMTRKNVPGDPITYEYDLVGNLTKAEDSDSLLQIAYDVLGRPVTVIQTNKAASLTSRLDYEYDANGNRTRMTLASSPNNLVWSYGYDSRDLLTSITDPHGRTVTFQYDSLGRRTKLSYSNGTESNYVFDDASQVLSITHKRTLDNLTLSSAAYTYDSAGNPASLIDDVGPHTYTYDQLHRLTGANHASDIAGLQSETFTYDAVGNRASDVTGSGFVHDANNRLTEDALFTYQYDSNGNRTGRTSKTSGSQTQYEWDKLDQLTRVIMPDGLVADYRYDARGRMIEVLIASATQRVERRIYSGPDVIATLDQAGSVTRIITHGRVLNEPLILAAGTTAYFYHADAFGSVRALSNASGQVVERTAYLAYGKPTFIDIGGSTYAVSQIGNPYAYTAAEWMGDVRLSNHQLRHLDLGTGEFISHEPFGFDGMNGYWYAHANPNKFVDPTGANAMLIGVAIAAPAWLPYAVVGGLIVVGAGAAYVWWQENRPYEPIMAEEEKKQPESVNPIAPPDSCPVPPEQDPNLDPNQDKDPKRDLKEKLKNTTDDLEYALKKLKIDKRAANRILHHLKPRTGRGGADNVRFNYKNGDIVSPQTGEVIGNLRSYF
ncbi:MAG: RHS repeat-associated core domain-containing protein [Armatimonadota bacterium]